jgi:hypothetical protein
VLGELAHGGAADRSDRSRCQQRRCEETHDETDPSADLGSLAAEVVTGLLHLDLSVGVLLDEDDPLDRDDFSSASFSTASKSFSARSSKRYAAISTSL